MSTRISALSNGAPLVGTDIVPYARGAGNVRGTINNLTTYLSANLYNQTLNTTDDVTFGDLALNGKGTLTTSGTRVLTIQGGGAQLVMKQFSAGNPLFMEYRLSSDTRRGWFGYGSSSNNHLSFFNEQTLGDVKLGTNGIARLIVKGDTGNIGIGTSAPGGSIFAGTNIVGMANFVDRPQGTATGQGTFYMDGGRLVNGDSLGAQRNVATNETLYIGTVDDKIQNTGTEGSIMASGLGSVTIAKERLVVGATFNIRIRGIITNVSTPTMAVTVKLGTVTIGATGSQQLTNITGTATFDMDFTFTVRNEGISGSAMAVGEFKTSTGDSLRMALLPEVTINTTIDQDIATLFKWTSVNASNSITAQTVTIQELSI